MEINNLIKKSKIKINYQIKKNLINKNKKQKIWKKKINYLKKTNINY